jgi:2-iminoacetate synthase
MSLVKAGEIGNICLPNALMTLQEYLCDYAKDETRKDGEKIIEKMLPDIGNEKTRGKYQGPA